MNNALTKTLTAGLMHVLKGIHNGETHLLTGVTTDEAYESLNVKRLKDNYHDLIHFEEFTPYLLPMSSLTKEIEFKGERFVPMQMLFGSVTFWKNYIDKPLSEWEHSKVDWLIEHHFNVFGLSPDEYIEVNETNNPYR